MRNPSATRAPLYRFRRRMVRVRGLHRDTADRRRDTADMADTAFKNVIDGELVDAASGETYDVIDPTTGEVYATAPMSGAEDVDRAYAAADAGLRGLGRDHAPGPRQRAAQDRRRDRGARSTRSTRSSARTPASRSGSPCRRRCPTPPTTSGSSPAPPGVLEGRSAGEYMADHTSWVRREPVGVVGQVTPWNYPLMMMIWKIAPALAAGNTVVLKPSDTTPASSTLLAELRPGVPAARRAQRRLR